jgi:hypothetical protein
MELAIRTSRLNGGLAGQTSLGGEIVTRTSRLGGALVSRTYRLTRGYRFGRVDDAVIGRIAHPTLRTPSGPPV